MSPDLPIYTSWRSIKRLYLPICLELEVGDYLLCKTALSFLGRECVQCKYIEILQLEWPQFRIFPGFFNPFQTVLQPATAPAPATTTTTTTGFAKVSCPPQVQHITFLPVSVVPRNRDKSGWRIGEETLMKMLGPWDWDPPKNKSSLPRISNPYFGISSCVGYWSLSSDSYWYYNDY